MTQVAYILTKAPNIRSEIEGWTYEDSSLLVRRGANSNSRKIFIGWTPAPRDIPDYGTILEMLADGWTMLGPPFSADDATGWDWWLTR